MNTKPGAGCVVPGLIDSHTHPFETGLELLYVSMTGARSIDEVLERLAVCRARASEWGTLLGFNLDPEALSEQRYPTRQELDRVTSSLPVLVYRVDGHSAVVNTAGLQLLVHITAPGFDLDEHGQPSGVIRGQAYEQASQAFKHRLRPEQVKDALVKCGELAASRGVTAIGALVGDDEMTDDDWAVMLDGLSSMPVRAVPFIQTWRPATAVRLGLRRVGGCLLIDGSFGSHTAALSEDYSDEPGNRGLTYETDETLYKFLDEATRLGLQTAVHAIGDRAVEQVVRVHERLDTGSTGNHLRHRIEHAELLSEDLVQRIARQKLVLGVQPVFEAWWGGPEGMYFRRLRDRWQRTNPYRSLLEARVVLAGGSDSPITPIDPLSGIRAAVAHPNPQQRLSPEQAYTMFTSAAAYSLGLERTNRAGDYTILTADPKQHSDCVVAATFRDGKCIYRNEELPDWLPGKETM